MRKLNVTDTHGFTVQSLLKEERKIKDTFFKLRMAAVRLIMEGHTTVQVAQVLGICRQSVSTYVKMFNRGGLPELLHRDFPPGNQPYLSEEEQSEIKRIMLESTPEKEGIEISASWDSRLLQKLIEERFGVFMSRQGITYMLHRMGFRYTRPTYTLKKANKTKQEAFITQLDMIKKTAR